jgi:hypothetical protein
MGRYDEHSHASFPFLRIGKIRPKQKESGTTPLQKPFGKATKDDKTAYQTHFENEGHIYHHNPLIFSF